MAVSGRYNRRVDFVPYQRRSAYPLHNVPEPHMRNLQRRATNHHTSLPNVVGELLAERYGMEFKPSRRPPTATRTRDLYLRLPPPVLDAIRKEAHVRNVTMRTVILDAISDFFRLKRPAPTFVEPGKRPGRPPERTPA